MIKSSLRKTITFVAVVGAIAISSFILLPKLFTPNEARTEMLKKYGLADLSVKDMVNKLDSITNEKDGLNASIIGTTLILYDNDKQYDFKLPTDEFYLSFAPYINEVHPCQTHNLVSCRGELFNKEFNVSIVKKDGTVITDQKVKSMNSGFIGIWLPRDIEATLTISYNGLSVTKTITTYAKSDTCLTTPLKLS
jgi:hypothetical protein